ncbi:MAG: alpha-galactosidase, partial [Haliscomenobacter sp.]|nr:alpha-galactosidase [Haliscomenobacter sp.]
GKNIGCFDFVNLTNQQQLIRAIKPEARLIIDHAEYQIGGLVGQKENGYFLPEWFPSLTKGENDFMFTSYQVTDIKPGIQWKSNTWTGKFLAATGKELVLKFESPINELKGLKVEVHYALYDGIPLIVKWLTIFNESSKEVKLHRVVNEVLGLVEEESAVVGSPDEMKKQHGIYFETNYAFNNAMRYDISDQTTHWKTDSVYTSQVNYNFQTPCLLEIYPEKAPGITLKRGEIFTSVKTNELLMDSYDRQRRGLMLKKMYRTIAPWTTQNPIFMHLVSKTDDEVVRCIDQCVQTGYEAVILSFGSHLKMEDTSNINITR